MAQKRAVLYARVSSDDRDNEGRNLIGQIEMCREYALSKGYVIVAELSEDDRGARGASFDLEKLNQALDMARNDEFDVLVVREMDRFARSLAKQLIVEQEFKRHGVEIDYVLGDYPDTPEGRLNKNIRAVIADYERLKITERLTRGWRQKIADGHVMTGKCPPYGYREGEKVIEMPDGTERRVQTLEIYEPEARIVQLAFSWYTEGDGEVGPMSISEVARRLSKMKAPTYMDSGVRAGGPHKKRKRGQWCRAVVHRMLKSERYIGIWRYGKRARVDGRWRRNPEECALIVRIPAIVSAEIWEAAQVRLAENRRNAIRVRRYHYLLRQRSVCRCGHKVVGTTARSRGKLYSYYRCRAKAPKGKKLNVDVAHRCDLPMFDVKLVDAAVWQWVRSWLSNPEQLADGLNEYRENVEQENTPLIERLKVVDDLLADNQTQLEKLLDLYLEGNFPKDMLLERRQRLETTISTLQREREHVEAEIGMRTLTQDQIQTLKDFSAQVAKKLTIVDQDPEAQRRIIELLNVQAMFTVEDGEKVVYVSGVLKEDHRVLPVSSATRDVVGQS